MEVITIASEYIDVLERTILVNGSDLTDVQMKKSEDEQIETAYMNTDILSTIYDSIFNNKETLNNEQN